MTLEYDLKDTLSLPEHLFTKYIDGYYIVVAPSHPNWIVLNEEEYKMFLWLKDGLSIREALENYYNEYCQNDESCIALMTKILQQIYDVDFYKDAEIKPEDPVDTITKKVHIGTTNGCNMRCSHCYMSAGTIPLETINLENTIQIVSELHNIYGELEIVISGGEPLTYKDIESLLRGILRNYVILFTNGSLISETNINLIAECCDEVQISFEGISRKYYSLIRGKQNYDKVLHAIELLKEYGVRIVLAITIIPSALNDIKNNLVKFVKELNYSNLEVRLSDEIEKSGNALSMDMSGFDDAESRILMINLVRELKELGFAVHTPDIRNTRFTNCGIGNSVVINYDGKVYPCHKISSYNFEQGKDIKKIIEEFNRINDNTSNDNMPKCYVCELRYICSGGCRIDNYVQTGSMTEPICDERYKEKQYRRLLSDFKMYREEV